MEKHKIPTLKTIKQIHIPTFIREGGVVEGYVRRQMVKIKEISTKHRSIEELTTYADKLNKEGFSNGEDFQKKILDLYSDGAHGISDPGLTQSQKRIFNIYQLTGSTFGDTFGNHTPEDMYKKLTDPKYLKDLHEINKILEKRFNDEFGLETERVNPFIFRTKLNLPDNANIGYATYSGSNGIFQDLAVLVKDSFDLNLNQNYSISNYGLEANLRIDSLIRGSNISQQKLEKTLIPAILLSKIFQPSFFYNPSTKSGNTKLLEENITSINTDLYNLMRSESVFGLSEKLLNYDTVLGDPDNDVKKPFLKYLNELNNMEDFKTFAKKSPDVEKSRQHLSNQMKGLKADEIVPNFIYMMENKATLNNFKNIIKKPFNEFTKVVSQKMFDAQNSRLGHVYISNNPMDFVTMSPHASITSCQSITDHGGGIGINEYNINIINSLHLNESNDFLMYTLDANPARKNTKINRTSLHYDNENKSISSCEEGLIYCKQNETNQLGDFLEKGDGVKLWDSIWHNNPEMDVEVFSNIHEFVDMVNYYEKMYEKAKNCFNEIKTTTEKSHKKFKSEEEISNYVMDQLDNFDKEIGNEEFDYRNIKHKVVEMTNIVKQKVKIKLHDIINTSRTQNESLLYGSKTHNANLLIHNGINNFVDDYKKVYIRMSENYISYTIENRNKLENQLNNYEEKMVKKLK